MLHYLLMLIPFKIMMAKPDSTKLILGNTLASREPEVKQSLKKATCAFYCIQSCHCLSSYTPLLPLVHDHHTRLFWLRCPKSASMLSMFPLRCLPRGKYSDVVMLLWYHLVPWSTDLSSCWRTMQESHHWFPSIVLCNSIAPQHPSTIERKMRCHWLQTSTMVWWSCCTASTCFKATLIRHAAICRTLLILRCQ